MNPSTDNNFTIEVDGSEFQLTTQSATIVDGDTTDHNSYYPGSEVSVYGPTVTSFQGVAGITRSHVSPGLKNRVGEKHVWGKTGAVIYALPTGKRKTLDIAEWAAIQFPAGESLELFYHRDKLIAAHVPSTQTIELNLNKENYFKQYSSYTTDHISVEACDETVYMLHGDHIRNRIGENWTPKAMKKRIKKLKKEEKLVKYKAFHIISVFIELIFAFIFFVHLTAGHWAYLKASFILLFISEISRRYAKNKKAKCGSSEYQKLTAGHVSPDVQIRFEWQSLRRSSAAQIKLAIAAHLGYDNDD